jgi:two-component system LytT family response regulator
VNGTNELNKMQNATSTTDVAFKAQESSKIALPQQSEIRYVEIAQIIRCEADDNYTKFVLDGENILVSRSLKEYADQLKPRGFLRTHQSHLINPTFVKSWLKEDGGMLLMNNGDKVSVSKPNRESVKIALEN